MTKIFFFIGIIFISLGFASYFGLSFSILTKLGNLPGDIKISRDNYFFYFPVTTCIVLSIILIFIIKLFSKI